MDEQIWEGQAKKLFYRAGLLKPRDVFDLVAASIVFPGAARTAVEASAPRRKAQLKRLNSLAAAPADQLSHDVTPIGAFKEVFPTMVASAVAWIESVDGMSGGPK